MGRFQSLVPRSGGNVWHAVLVALRGVGQIMFQGHAATGAFFLAGLAALQNPPVLIGAVMGAAIGPIFAVLAGYDREHVEQGLYGFNSTLVGLAIPVFLLSSDPRSWVVNALGCVLATVITWLGLRFLKFPAFTGPFVVATWITLLATHGLMGHAFDVPSSEFPLEEGGFLAEVLRGESEVMLGDNQLTGALFLVGIAISNPWHAFLAFLGSVIGTGIGHYHGDPANNLSVGIYGYNGALAAESLSLAKPALALPILAAGVSTLLVEYFPGKLGIPALTAPFVAAAWLVLLTVWIEHRLFGKRAE